MSRSLEFPAILGLTGAGAAVVLGVVVVAAQHEIGPAIGPEPAAAEVVEAPVAPPVADVGAEAEPAEPTAGPVEQTPSAPLAVAEAKGPSGLGRAALPEEIEAWDVAVLPDGQGLPVGSGDVLAGEEVFAEACAACHGEFAEGLDSWPVLAGGQGSLTDPRPVKTIGSYWPHLSTVFDYVHRSMPFGAAQTMTVDQTYAITAFLLYSNGLVDDDFVLSNENFTSVVLPNAAGFYADDRAEAEYKTFSAEPCMENCRTDAPVVAKRAVDLNVTPEDPDGRPAGTLPDLAVARAETSPALSGLGRAALPEEIEAWDVAVLPDGQGLPVGSGDVLAGEEVFAEACAACHGEFAEGLDSWPVLAGGQGSLTDPRPVKTIGSYWPHLSTVFDYVHRSMPFGAAQTMTVDQTYAITAFLLYSNGLVDDDFVLSNENFTSVVLPNAAGFYADDRPEAEYKTFTAEPCMENCRTDAPVVAKRAVDLNVTPEDPDGKPAGTLPDLRVASVEGAVEPAEDVAHAEDATEAGAPEAADPAGVDPALVAAGETVFKKCASCHKLGEGAKNGTGPHLTGIIGRPAGAAEGFKYSKPLTDAATGGLVWDAATLDAFLADPKGFLPKNRMSFAGLKSADDRAAVIAYLASVGG